MLLVLLLERLVCRYRYSVWEGGDLFFRITSSRYQSAKAYEDCYEAVVRGHQIVIASRRKMYDYPSPIAALFVSTGRRVCAHRLPFARLLRPDGIVASQS